MSATTSRWRGVIRFCPTDMPLSLTVLIMSSRLVSLDRGIHSPQGVSRGVFARTPLLKRRQGPQGSPKPISFFDNRDAVVSGVL
jgi:hypothetical protein